MSNPHHHTDVVLIGAGPVGLFAVFQCGMLGLSCHVIDSLDVIGGQCSALYPEKPIYDIPAYPSILATDLVERLAEQAAPFAPVYHLGQAATALTPLEQPPGGLTRVVQADLAAVLPVLRASAPVHDIDGTGEIAAVKARIFAALALG
mgnify:CR=1 FL=1